MVKMKIKSKDTEPRENSGSQLTSKELAVFFLNEHLTCAAHKCNLEKGGSTLKGVAAQD